jgi:hypothetical protein
VFNKNNFVSTLFKSPLDGAPLDFHGDPIEGQFVSRSIRDVDFSGKINYLDRR